MGDSLRGALFFERQEETPLQMETYGLLFRRLSGEQAGILKKKKKLFVLKLLLFLNYLQFKVPLTSSGAGGICWSRQKPAQESGGLGALTSDQTRGRSVRGPDVSTPRPASVLGSARRRRADRAALPAARPHPPGATWRGRRPPRAPRRSCGTPGGRLPAPAPARGAAGPAGGALRFPPPKQL